MRFDVNEIDIFVVECASMAQKIVTAHKRCVWKPKGRNDNRASLLMPLMNCRQIGRGWTLEEMSTKEKREKSAMDSLNGMNESLETRRENATVCEIRRSHLIYWIIIMFGLRFIGYTRFRCSIGSLRMCATIHRPYVTPVQFHRTRGNERWRKRRAAVVMRYLTNSIDVIWQEIVLLHVRIAHAVSRELRLHKNENYYFLFLIELRLAVCVCVRGTR